jgi:hypothetical protein
MRAPPESHPALPPLVHVALQIALLPQLASPDGPQLASQDGPQPADGAPSADWPAAIAINISPNAKIVFLLAVMFPSCLGLLRSNPQKRANR